MPRSVLLLSLDLAAGGVRAGDGSDKITVRELLRRGGGGRHLSTAHTATSLPGAAGERAHELPCLCTLRNGRNFHSIRFRYPMREYSDGFRVSVDVLRVICADICK